MRVNINFYIDIDEQEWARQYPADMRDLPGAANRYAATVVKNLWFDLGLATEGAEV